MDSSTECSTNRYATMTRNFMLMATRIFNECSDGRYENVLASQLIGSMITPEGAMRFHAFITSTQNDLNLDCRIAGICRLIIKNTNDAFIMSSFRVLLAYFNESV